MYITAIFFGFLHRFLFKLLLIILFAPALHCGIFDGFYTHFKNKNVWGTLAMRICWRIRVMILRLSSFMQQKASVPAKSFLVPILRISFQISSNVTSPFPVILTFLLGSSLFSNLLKISVFVFFLFSSQILFLSDIVLSHLKFSGWVDPKIYSWSKSKLLWQRATFCLKVPGSLQRVFYFIYLWDDI